MKRTIVALSVLTLCALSVQPTHAFWPFDGAKVASSTTTNPTFMDRLIEKFGLNKDEVQKVADDYRTERQTEMKKAFEDRLTAAVTAGKLSQEKKQLIVQKHDELLKQHEQDMTNRQSQREALEKWAADNDVDMSYFGNGGQGRGKGGVMGGRGMGRGMRVSGL